MSGTAEENSELLTEAFENPESTPVHLPRQADDKSSIIRRAIGELGSKDSTKPGKDRRETQC